MSETSELQVLCVLVPSLFRLTILAQPNSLIRCVTSLLTFHLLVATFALNLLKYGVLSVWTPGAQVENTLCSHLNIPCGLSLPYLSDSARTTNPDELSWVSFPLLSEILLLDLLSVSQCPTLVGVMCKSLACTKFPCTFPGSHILC